MDLNYTLILVASVLQFIIGGIWYTPIFGKTWGKMHDFDKVAPEVQKQMMKDMWKLLVPQMLFTVVTTFVFALLLTGFPNDWNIYGLAAFFWIGFIVPTQVSGVLFGGTKPEWIVKKILIMAGGSLLCMLAAAFVLSYR